MNLGQVLLLVRIALTIIAVGLASFPLLVMLDLAEGGTGFGLCPGGVTTCRNPYTAAPELTLALSVGLFLVLSAFRVVTHIERRARAHRTPNI